MNLVQQTAFDPKDKDVGEVVIESWAEPQWPNHLTDSNEYPQIFKDGSNPTLGTSFGNKLKP